MNKIINLRILILLIFVFTTGVAIIWWIANLTDKNMRAELLIQARIAAQAINIKDVASLSGSEKDLNKPAYQRIKNQIASMRKVLEKFRFLYLMGRRSDGEIFFFVDSLSPDSKDYAPPGLIYDEVSSSYILVFETNEEAVVGPVTDRWGTLITALVPLRDSYKGNVIAVLGMDVDASYWNKEILSRCFFPFIVMLLFMFLILLLVSREKVAKSLRQSENKLRAILDATPFPVAVVDLNDEKIFYWSRSALTLFGHTAPTTPEWYQIAYPNPDYRQEVIEKWKPLLKKAQKVGQPINTGEYRVTCKDGSERICELYVTFFPEHMIVTFNDITERNRPQTALLRRSEFEQLVIKISSELAGVSSGGMDSVIDQALASIGAFTGADRAYLFQLKNIDTQIHNTHEWCADGVEPQIQNLKNIQVSEKLPWFFEQLRKFKVFHAPDVGALPSEARLEREHFEAQNIKSLVAIPMKTMGHLTGFIGFDATREHRIWSDEYLRLLQLVAETISHVIERNRGEEARKKADDEIMKQKRLFETMFNTIPDGVVITNKQREIQLANKGMESTFGYTPEELLGKSTQILYSDQSKYRQTGAAVFDRDAESSRNLYVTRYRDKSGREFSGETFGAKLFDENNQWIGNLGIMRDITEREQAEKELCESNDRFRLLFEKAPLAYQALDENGNFIEINDTWLELLGYKREEVIGRNFSEFLHPDWQEHFKINFPRFKAVGEVLGIEFEIAKKDGSFMLVSFHGKIGHTPNGTFKQTHCVFSDVTEQKRIESEKTVLEAKLLQSQKMESIGTLAGGIAHDFNNILSSILGFTELALDAVEKDTSIEDSLQEVYAAGKRARDLVKQILTLSRHDEKEIKPIQLIPLIKEALKMLRATIPTSIEFQDDICGESLIVNADSTQLHQVIVNLVTNARHAMVDRSGLIEIGVDTVSFESDIKHKYPDMEPANFARITVSDNGMGIPEKDIGKIFEPYFTTKEKGEGTGLGLSVVHGIVKSHNGHITVFSKPGKGTTFHVYLPLIKKASVQLPNIVNEPLPTGSEQVLLVDDEPSVAKMQQQNLERMGYTVTTKINSMDALEVFRAASDKYDLVITDMTMPNMTGDKLAREIKAIRSNIPVILCTGFSEMINDNGESLDIDGFLMKPVDLSKMLKTVRKVLDEAKR